ncbi:MULTISPECIES: hypothetical protein [Oceanobacillus]|uniref:WYL domain-containing protein n=1 Tax=Oceanobacillus neutriphilus TaxID=531815 RepID=A0ABQ2NN43_9BACI|nr:MULTISPECIES: hypothetical protein [Oceanobacillus]MCT1902077.1 WYL domain-containing protein [Oceanobacillus sojae]GGP07511.1 hypothetical protein GCM10011346_03790 [Oceanobacillus neutriphilus]
MIGFLTNAMEQKNKIMIYYLGKDNNVTQRIIRVVQIEETKILAYCYYRKQVRSFIIDNILSFGRVNEENKYG